MNWEEIEQCGTWIKQLTDGVEDNRIEATPIIRSVTIEELKPMVEFILRKMVDDAYRNMD